jgi:hypothetical protein
MTNLQSPIDSTTLPLYAMAWHRALASVPTNYLDEYYLRAFNRKPNGFPVTATDIIAEWNRCKEKRHIDSLMPESERGNWY